MVMRGFLVAAVVAMGAFAWAASAGAQQAPQVYVPPQELPALQHHQPTQSEVDERERQLYGDKGEAARQAKENAEVDQLYRQLTGTSPGASPPPHGNGPTAGSGSATGK